MIQTLVFKLEFVHDLNVCRVAIARDVASGLLYLHEETVNRIIHRDVKPANILLDEKMNARVADFGLARLVGDQEIDVVTNVMGTRGYLAPGTYIHIRTRLPQLV